MLLLLCPCGRRSKTNIHLFIYFCFVCQQGQNTVMRPFYPTAATFHERKRKLLQFPEKLKTIGKYHSCCLSSLFVCVCVCVRGSPRSRTLARWRRTSSFSVDRLQISRHLCLLPELGWALCFGLSHKQCHAYTVKSAASALSLFHSHLPPPQLWGGFNLSFLKPVSHGCCAFPRFKALLFFFFNVASVFSLMCSSVKWKSCSQGVAR